MALLGSGSGFGTRKLQGMSNVLRALAFEPLLAPGSAALVPDDAIVETLVVCAFEVDDQSAEDLAVGLEHVRALDGVLDVVQAPVLAKKGRMAVHVRVLARPTALDSVIAACLDQTSTLGVRHHAVQRTSLDRDEGVATVRTGSGQPGGEHTIRVKQVIRPHGGVTRKAEMDDLAHGGGTRAAREQLRHEVETPHPEDPHPAHNESEADSDD
jgi:uncharacterized protein (DUF111 family)